MHLAYPKKLGLDIRKTDVRAQKIDCTTLETFGMVIAVFSIHDKARKICFFEETFLLANINIDVALGISFLTLSNTDIGFTDWELYWRSYNISEALPTICRIELIDQKEFAVASLGKDDKVFVVHMASLVISTEMTIHPFWIAQIASLITDEAPVTVPIEYFDFADIFSPESVAEPPEHTKINDHLIELIDNWQPSYGPIYNLGPVELETLKTYIKANLANGFTCLSKSLIGAPILFVWKPDASLWLWVNYQGLNNFTIKNRYPHPLIDKLLDRLSRARYLTQLDLTSVYHRMRIWEGDEWKTAFYTQYGYFQYQVMSFGLSNISTSFQGYINKIWAKMLDIFVIIYLDDILIYTKDSGQGHLEGV